MKFLILAALVLALGVFLVITLLQFQQPELQTTLTEIESETLQSEPASVEVIATVKEETTTAEPEEESLSATESACLALEQNYLEAFDDAERELERKLRDYDKADEIFDDYLGADNRDEARVDELRENKKLAEDEYDEAKQEFNGAKKRLNRARDECGLR